MYVFKWHLVVLIQLFLLSMIPNVLAVNLPEIPVLPEFPIVNSNGNVFYVAKDQGCDDSHHGSKNHPYKTIQYGVQQLHPGDTLIVISASTPYNEEVWISCAGISSNYITIQGEDGQNIKLVSPSDKKYTYRGFALKNTSSYIYLKNFEISGKYLYGINLRNGCHHIVVENIKLFDNKYGILINGANYINIKDCEVYKSTGGGVKIYQDSGIKTEQIIFRNISSHNNSGTNVDGFNVSMAATDSGRPTNSNDLCHNLYISHCKSFKNGGEGFDLGLVKKAVLINCDAYDNDGQGVKLWGKENWLVGCLSYKNKWAGIDIKPLYDMDIYILNCTIADNEKVQIRNDPRNTMRGVVTELSHVVVHAYNNVVSYKKAHDFLMYFIDISKYGAVKEDNNLLYSPRKKDYAFQLRNIDKTYKISDINNGNWSRNKSFAGINTFVALPGLDENYVPKSKNSAVINRGLDIGLSYDRLGVSRQSGGKIDIGAYEFVGTSNLYSSEVNKME